MENFAPRGTTPDRTIPNFHLKAVEMPFKSREAGRPIFEDREYVEIIIPGRNKSTAIEPVNDEHKKRWPEAYRAFKDGQSLPVNGTPIEEWSVLSAATVANFRSLNIRTVEDIAAATDDVLQNMGQGGFSYRQRAQAFLDQAQGSAPLERALQELDQLKAKNEVLEGQVRDLAAIVRDLEGDEDKSVRRGGTPSRRGG